MDDIIDLDVFIPEPRILHFADQDITVDMPKTVDLIQLGYLTSQLNDGNDMSDDQIQAIIDKITERIYKMIPELTGKPLNKAQLQLLVDIFSRMAMPKSYNELEKRGITIDTPKKAP